MEEIEPIICNELSVCADVSHTCVRMEIQSNNGIRRLIAGTVSLVKTNLDVCFENNKGV